MHTRLRARPFTHFLVFSLLIVAACTPRNSEGQSFQATVVPTRVGAGAPMWTATPSFTPRPAATNTSSATPSPTGTPTLAASATPTATSTPSQTPTPLPTDTPAGPPTVTSSPTIAPTQPLFTLTPASSAGAPPAFLGAPAGFSPTEGWSCDDFPCEDDIDGFLQRIQVPDGYTLAHVGRFPGQPMQITYGPDGRLYATVLEGGTRNGAVYAMDSDGQTTRYSGTFVSPVGLAFQPGTDVLYVSARVTLESGGGLWRVLPDGSAQAVITDLPCCFQVIGSQPNGLIFGPDGYLYLGVGGLTDQGEATGDTARRQPYADILPDEAAILRIQPHTGESEVYASGIRNPYDLAFTSGGQLYATDSGMLSGPGDRLLAINPGEHYGWPYWRTRGCENCPSRPPLLDVQPDMVSFPDYTLPRGVVAYTGTQFPANDFDTLFVALWNGTESAQRIVRIDPDDPRLGASDYNPEPFVTGLIRPIDVALAPDGSLVVADFIYGHIWRVGFEG